VERVDGLGGRVDVVDGWFHGLSKELSDNFCQRARQVKVTKVTNGGRGTAERSFDDYT
jgi:hypothetical protein